MSGRRKSKGREQGSGFRSGEFVEKFARSENANALVVPNCQKVFIAGDDQIGVSHDRTLDDYIVIGVAADAMKPAGCLNLYQTGAEFGEHTVKPGF